MSNQVETSEAIEAEVEETALREAEDGRKEPELGSSSVATTSEAAFDAEFDDVALEKEVGSLSTTQVAVTDVPLQDRPVPRISIEAFCKSPDNGAVMQQVASDRRLSRAHVAVHMGGIDAAVQHFSITPTPNLVLVEAGHDNDEIVKGLEALAQVCDAGTKVIVIGQVNDILLYRELIRQGVSEYIVSPLNVPQVIDAISGLYVDPTATPIGRSLVFTGAKGGTGSSTLAHNVSWCIAEKLAHDVTLIDLDLPFGTAGLDFNEDPSQGIADALIAPERLDDQLLDRLLVKASEHLSLFTAPGVLDRDFELESDAFENVLDVVRGTVPCMVVDLPHMWVPWTRHLLLTADEIVITATPDLASLRNTKNLVDLLKQSREFDNPPKLVLNQFGIAKRPEIPAKEFSEAVGIPVDLTIPFDPQLFGTAANNGQMVGEMKPDSKVTQGILELAGLIAQRDPVTKKKSGSVSKFWSQLIGK
jgi:pilus assembly protein CpaE